MSQPSSFRSLLALPITLAMLANAGSAQCEPIWQGEQSLAGTNGRVHAITVWDPDGSGPAVPWWIFGGDFTFAGDGPANRLAAFDPASGRWQAIPGGTDGPIHALAVLPGGELVVGGEFTSAGGIAATNIAQWNGTSWSALAGGCAGGSLGVQALHVRPNGTLVAGGGFTLAGSSPAARIASWNGSVWSSLGAGIDGPVTALCSLPSGDLLAGGYFPTAGGVPVGGLARWNGNTWSAFGSTSFFFFSGVLSLLATPGGEVFVGGTNLFGSTASLVRLGGGSSPPLSPVPLSRVDAIALLPNGDLVAGGGGSLESNIRRWNGSSWSVPGSGLAFAVDVLHDLGNGELLAGGEFLSGGPGGLSHVARWTGTEWQQIGPGSGPTNVTALAHAADGDLVAGYQNMVGFQYHVARRRQGQWSALGSSPPNGPVRVLYGFANGDILAGGPFSSIGGVAITGLARWNGTTWSALGNGLNGSALAIVRLANGDLLVGGSFTTAGGAPARNIARWNGSSWAPLGPGLANEVYALQQLPNGDVVAGGAFDHDGSISLYLGRIGRWNGSTWSNLGIGMPGHVSSLALRRNGDLVVGGASSTGPDLRVWNGSWSIVPITSSLFSNQAVHALHVLPDDDVLVAGTLFDIGGLGRNHVGRWTGSAWRTLTTAPGPDTGIRALSLAPTGQLVVGGAHQTAAGILTPGLARLQPTCAPSVTLTGLTCVGSGGPLVLQPISMPWLGTTFRSRATGFGPNSIGLHALGVQALSLPLPAVLPQGVAGCVLSVAPEVIDAFLPVGGAIELGVPLSPLLIWAGFTFEQQVAALELDTSGNIVALTSSNGLHVVEGAF